MTHHILLITKSTCNKNKEIISFCQLMYADKEKPVPIHQTYQSKLRINKINSKIRMKTQNAEYNNSKNLSQIKSAK